MTPRAATIEAYIASLPEERQQAMERLRKTIKAHLPKGFSEEISYGMIGYVVPHSRYPSGYHCDPKLPLPFLAIASQKNFVAVYHMGVYADPVLLEWFVKEYPTHSKTKLDMGKSCIRFKKIDAIPHELIGQLCEKMSVDQCIELYEREMKR